VKDDCAVEKPLSKKFVGKALEEINAGKIEITAED